MADEIFLNCLLFIGAVNGDQTACVVQFFTVLLSITPVQVFHHQLILDCTLTIRLITLNYKKLHIVVG